VNREMPDVRRGSPFADRPPDRSVNRQDRVDNTLKDIAKLSLQLHSLRKDPPSSGNEARLRALEQNIQSKWDEVRALRAGAHHGPR
jgi:hypothetical protein